MLRVGMLFHLNQKQPLKSDYNYEKVNPYQGHARAYFNHYGCHVIFGSICANQSKNPYGYNNKVENNFYNNCQRSQGQACYFNSGESENPG